VTTRWSPFFKQLIMIAGLIGAVWLVFRLRTMLAPLILAILFAYIISLPVNRIEKRTGWPRTLLAAIVLLAAVVLVVVVSVLVAPRLYSLIVSFGTTLLNVVAELLEVEPRPVMITPELSFDLGPFYRPVNQWLRSVLQPDQTVLENLQRLFYPFASGAASVVIGAVSSFFWVIFTLVLIFLLVRDGPRLRKAVMGFVPAVWQPEVKRLIAELEGVWNLFVRGQVLLSIVMGFIVWIVMSVLGVRNAPALGLLAGLLEFIPGIGLTIAAVPGVLIALFLGSTWLPIPNAAFAIVVTVAYIILGQIDNTYLLPRIVGRRVALHPVVVIVGAAAGAQLAGVLGILLAAPVIASLRIASAYVISKLFDLPPFPEAPPVDRAQAWVDAAGARPVRAVLFDLDGTLIETDNRYVAQAMTATGFLDQAVTPAQRERVARRILMFNEGIGNGLITLADVLRLDGALFKVNRALHRFEGVRDPGDFILVDGVDKTLQTLDARGYRLGIVTTRNRQDTAIFLSHYGLGDLFSAVVTRDDVRRLKPHPMPVLKAAELLGLSPEQCVMVGDTRLDVRAAHAAGALAVGVLCGFGDAGDLQDAELVLASPAQLDAWL
jgi:HAD superfamily hydrolase (TIGR01509 family)